MHFSSFWISETTLTDILQTNFVWWSMRIIFFYFGKENTESVIHEY